MREAQQISVKVQIPGKENTPPLQRQLTLETVCKWIKLQGFDEYTTDGLIELAKKYPTQALPSFRRNFNLMIQRVRSQRQRENRMEEERAEEEKRANKKRVSETTVTEAEYNSDFDLQEGICDSVQGCSDDNAQSISDED